MAVPIPLRQFDPDSTVPERRLRILIADDDRDTTATLALLFAEHGHAVREVYRGDAVLLQLRDFMPDVLLLDIGMPGMSGYEVAREIKHLFGDESPVLVAITGLDKSADKILGKIIGFDEYVTKPYDPQTLLAMVDALAPRSAKPA